MCGIVGYSANVCKKLMLYNGIVALQNRGYDSVGICTINNKNNFINTKFIGNDAIEELKKSMDLHGGISGISHCRWATHGEKNFTNAHPLIDFKNRFAIVHNGIIDNYNEIKNMLIDNYNVSFTSQTDSEVIINLISIQYDIMKNLNDAIKYSCTLLKGTWAFIILNKYCPNELYAVCHECPLIFGVHDDFILISSEMHGFCGLIEKYFTPNDDDVIFIKNNQIINYNYQLNDIMHIQECITPKPYEHWTIKEIHDQPAVIENIINQHIDNDKIIFPELNNFDINQIEHVLLIGCGTSYNSCLIGSHYLKKIKKFVSVSTFDGAEFYDYDIPKSKNILAIFISQSGETKDLQRKLKFVKKYDFIKTIGIINVPNSWIAKQVDICICNNAGREIAVASTKAFTSQVVILYLLSMFWSSNNDLENLHKFKQLFYSVLNNEYINKQSMKIAEYLVNFNNCFILGKDVSEFIAHEASLKFKELGYIHADSYNSSALKHGTYSLIEKNTPVIIIMPSNVQNCSEVLENDNYTRNLTIIEEVKSRSAFVITISDNVLKTPNINININIEHNVPNNFIFTNLLCVIPLQLIAYHMAIQKKHNPDLPRNLAKVVTVD